MGDILGSVDDLKSHPYIYLNDNLKTISIGIAGIEMNSDNIDKGAALFQTGYEMLWDGITANPKRFAIDALGAQYRDSSFNYTTPLIDIASMATKFSSVEFPPNATTLKLNDTLLLDDGSLSTEYKILGINYPDTTTFTIRNPTDPNNQGQIALTSDSANPSGSSIVMAAENFNFGGSAFSFGGNQFNCSAGFNLNTSNAAINLDSGTNTTAIGDLNGANNNTTFRVEDTNKQILGYTNGGLIDFTCGGGIVSIGDAGFLSNGTSVKVDDGAMKVELGDIGNVGNLMKIVVDNGAGVINIDNGGDAPINIGDLGANGNATSISVNDATATFTINFPTINFQNTSTTTSTSNHNANIRATSSGLDTTSFLKCQLNGADIWIPYFTTDPSL